MGDLKKGDSVTFTYSGEVRKGVVESYKPSKKSGNTIFILTIKDENRGGAFRSFQKHKCEGLVNLSQAVS